MMDCKKALQETGGDVDGAVTYLREKGIAGAAKLGGREATEGTVQSYIHANGKVGVLVEVDCNTDFVAKNDDFTAFARDIALHIAASPATRWVTEEDVPEDVRAEELRIAASQMTHVPERAASGKVSKGLEEVVLLKQVHVNGEKYENKTIEQLRTELSARTGE